MYKAYILDFGCGEGRWLEENGGPGVIGIDLNPVFLKEARQKAKEGTELILCDGHRLPFKDKSFKMVNVWEVLHHMKIYRFAIKEIDRVLEGPLSLSESIDNDPVFRIARRITMNWRGIPIESLFRSFELIAEIEKYFKIDEIEYIGYLPFWHPFAQLGFRSKVITYLGRFYNILLRKFRIEKMLASCVQIQCHNNTNEASK